MITVIDMVIRQEVGNQIAWIRFDDGLNTRWFESLVPEDAADLNTWAVDNAERMWCCILRQEYGDADLSGHTGTDLEMWASWIIGGCQNPNGEIIDRQPWPLTYRDVRASLYPPLTDLADALVKVNNSDPVIIEAGQMQLDEYYATCNGVKHRITY